MPSFANEFELQQQLRRSLGKKLDIDPERISLEDDIVADLGADSLTLAELSFEVETALGVVVPGFEWLDITTVGELVKLVQRYHQPEPTEA